MSFNLTQAVILAGGLGTRLLPLTKDLPKPMVSVNGIPFLEHLLLQLKQQGIRRVLLLTGYLQEKIESYFRDGSEWGMEISYSHGETEWDTGRRLFRARHLIDDRFFLLYGDNFYNYNLSKLKGFFQEREFPLTLVVTPKEKGNIRLDSNGKIVVYDSSRSQPQLTHVELGFMILQKNLLEDIRDELNPSFSRTLERLTLEGKVGGFQAHDVYHSISDLKRLSLTEEYLRPKKIILIDRDGTINHKAPRGKYITHPENLTLLPESVSAMKRLSREGFRFIVVTNQAGLSTGDLSSEQLEAIHQKMKDDLRKEGVEITGIYTCGAHWQDTENWYRKPNPGMFYQISREHQLYLRSTFYIGDDPRDMEAANRCDTRGVFLGRLDDLSGKMVSQVAFASISMTEIADYILKEFSE